MIPITYLLSLLPPFKWSPHCDNHNNGGNGDDCVSHDDNDSDKSYKSSDKITILMKFLNDIMF